MEDKTYTYIFYDILDKVLQLSENPSQFSDFLTQQIRELIGARTVVIAVKDKTKKPAIFSVCPSRRTEWCKQNVMLQLAEFSFGLTSISYLSNDSENEYIAQLLKQIEIEKVIAIPLSVGSSQVGAILLLDIMDLFGIDAVIDLLTRLSGVFALIIRNALLYHNLEELVTFRTNELQKRNNELIEQEKQLKSANEEYEALNEELSESLERVEVVNQQLEKAKEKAEESDRLKTEFINNMSHEIRTPMNGILGFSNMLDKPKQSPEKRKQYINIIQNSGNQLMRIIDDILEISKLGTKQVTAVEKECCINNLFLELFTIFDIKAKENKTPLYLNKGLQDEASIIYTDETKLNKILSNLLENALKFTNEGFIEFGYRLKKDNASDKMEIYVKDTGIGINKNKHESIFERFSQEEKELSKKVGGLGLGLSIAKENAELLGGNITLESIKGEGATFFVTIPYKPVTLSSPENNSKLTQKEQEKYTVLVVEDEEVNYLFIEILIEDEIDINCNILHAHNGKVAVDICNERKDVDLILMDLKMPVMNGFEATKIIKERYPNLPIIAQSAYTSAQDKEKAWSAGCDDYLTKPLNEEVLNAIMKKYLMIK